MNKIIYFFEFGDKSVNMKKFYYLCLLKTNV